MTQNQSKETIAIVGFGYIGCTIGAALADRGYPVLGVEPFARIRELLADKKSPFNEPGLQDVIDRAHERINVGADVAVVSQADVIVVTVGTPLSDDGNADLSQIKEAAEQIGPHLKNGQLVVLKSTVPPRTTEDVVAPILARYAKVQLAFCPERLAEGQAIRDLFSIPVVVGGVDALSTEKAATFWKEALGVETIAVRSALAAEMVKLADNLWIDLNIALANELALLCDKLGGVDVLEVIRAANTLPKVGSTVNILIPSLGVGGYCLTKDPWFVHGMGKQHGLDMLTPQTSRRVNDKMPAYSVGLIEQHLSSTGKAAKDCKVCVLGVAFKNNTGDCRLSPTEPAIRALIEKGYNVNIHDPWVTDEEAEKVAGIPPQKDIDAALEGADCVAFFTGHKDFQELEISHIASKANAGALVFDGRIFFSPEKIAEIQSAGMHYKGVGR